MDREGRYSREGKLLYEVLDKWNNLEYYKKEAPKSLGREWVEGVYLEGLYEDILLPKDLMHTAVNHFAKQIAQQLPKQGRVLITGGGAYNSFFNEKLRSETSCELIYPSKEIIEFKEALIFGLLGYLRWNNKINVLKSVTGASQNHSSGIIYLP
jgi:anhydro-N-acetylmuramic acid kinase